MESSALIVRNYTPSDEKLLRLLVGRAVLGGLAEANKRSSCHPLTLTFWFAMSAITTRLLSWDPKPDFGWAGYLAPLPAFACCGMLLLYLLDRYNRPFFEDHMAAVLRCPDLRDITSYYSKSASSFFILEFNRKVIGFVALDAAGLSQDSGIQGSSSYPQLTQIRHFFIEEAYRQTYIQNDLMKHALRHTFTKDSTIQEIQMESSALDSYIERSLVEAGFKRGQTVRNVGLYGWPIHVYTLSRVRWRECSL